ncbi:unnamed protein product [Cuscuta epithymum]|uniref:Retrovirus-related Pol polyprotein from transposon TNT 1-94-like beta-barrel domain-containing protein n=1 Tax=Cuscuta epithymum TaxID=186058 RepID=A0AAV0G3P3_9ASTE|nr:unnamed protein product [Cuscuta epithymum]
MFIHLSIFVVKRLVLTGDRYLNQHFPPPLLRDTILGDKLFHPEGLNSVLLQRRESGLSTVHVKSPNGCMLKLNGVRHIPGLRRNLLSIGQLDEEGYAVTFGNRNWKITKGALLVAKGKKEGTLYM